MASFVKEMERDLAFERLQIEKVLAGARRRGDAFFQERVVLTQVPSLVGDPNKFKADFVDTVLAGVDDRIDEVINDVAVLMEVRC